MRSPDGRQGHSRVDRCSRLVFVCGLDPKLRQASSCSTCFQRIGSASSDSQPTSSLLVVRTVLTDCSLVANRVWPLQTNLEKQIESFVNKCYSSAQLMSRTHTKNKRMWIWCFCCLQWKTARLKPWLNSLRCVLCFSRRCPMCCNCVFPNLWTGRSTSSSTILPFIVMSFILYYPLNCPIA